MNFSKVQAVITKTLDLTLVFGAGALLDPNVAHFLGSHQGVATGIAIALAVLRAVDKALGGKATQATASAAKPSIPPVV